MDRLIYGDFVDAEELKPHSPPSRKHATCAICSGGLSQERLLGTNNGHDMFYKMGICKTCGWWDLIYEEWGMQDEPEEFTYFHAIVRDFRESEPDSGLQPTIVAELRRNPAGLYDLPPRRLEVLVRDLVTSAYGCDAELTKQTRDGGKDIIGFDSNRGKFIVEVKRYRRERKVGVEIVRQVVGAMCIEGVQRGLLVTTSAYSRDARALSEVLRAKIGWELDLKDFRDICAWLDLYHHPLVDIKELERKLDARLYSFPRGELGVLFSLDALPGGAC